MPAGLQLDAAIPTVVATIANIEEFKPEHEEYVNIFINGKYIVSLLQTGFGERLIYQFASLAERIDAEINTISLFWSVF